MWSRRLTGLYGDEPALVGSVQTSKVPRSDQTPANPSAEPRVSLPLPRSTVRDRTGGLIRPVSQPTFRADSTPS